MKPDRNLLQRELGYRFANEGRLDSALTHRSAGRDNNERLEFLGDALLNLTIAEAAYLAFPDAQEGDLSRLRSTLVREETLAEVARRIDLGEYLKLGSGELKSGGYRRGSILADALEALIGAVYLDGGYGEARELCLRLFAAELAALPDPAGLKDPKTRLQERLQAAGRPLPEYVVLNEEGPAHARRFQVRCQLNDETAETQGEGGSRKHAEQQAAERMLELLQQQQAKHA